jgi:hypothetical protein
VLGVFTGGRTTGCPPFVIRLAVLVVGGLFVVRVEASVGFISGRADGNFVVFFLVFFLVHFLLFFFLILLVVLVLVLDLTSKLSQIILNRKRIVNGQATLKTGRFLSPVVLLLVRAREFVKPSRLGPRYVRGGAVAMLP